MLLPRRLPFNGLIRILLVLPFLLASQRMAQSFATAAVVLPSNLIGSQQYDMSQLDEPFLRQCALHAVAQLNNHTCMTFNEELEEPEAADVHFIQTAPNGQCGVNPTNASILLNRQCVTNFDVCLQLVARILTGQKKSAGAVLGHLNQHFGCNDNCNLQCGNGGILLVEECRCQCPFNGLFQGENCTELMKLGDYTDTSCGSEKAEDKFGELHLSGPLDGNTYCQWLVQAPSPWSQLEIKFYELELSKKFAGIDGCLDKFEVYGLEQSPKLSVKCTKADKPSVHQKFKSAGNFLLFQLEASRFDRTARAGPRVHYTVKELFSDEIQESSSGGNAGADDTSMLTQSPDWDVQHGGSGADQSGGIFAGTGGIPLFIAFCIVPVVVALIVLSTVAMCVRRHRLRHRSIGKAGNGKDGKQNGNNNCSSSPAHAPLPTSSPIPPADESA